MGSSPVPKFQGGNAWVSIQGDAVVEEMVATSGQFVASHPLALPYAMVTLGSDVWVLNAGNDTVAKFDGVDGSVVGVYPAGHFPNGIGTDGTNIWISDQVVPNTLGDASFEAGTVTELAGATGANVATYTVGVRTQWVA